MAVSLSGLSRSIEEAAPDQALIFNPLNAEARVNSLVGLLNQPDGAPSDDLLDSISTGLATDPIDARFHSLLAETRLRQGDRVEAYRLFEQALALSRTELHALKHLVVRAVEAGNFGEAVKHLDQLLRRWPGHGEEIYPVLPALLADGAGYEALIAAMAEGAPWRGAALRALASEEAGLGQAYRVLMGLAATPRPAASNEIASVLRGFLRAERHEEAYRLFRFTLPPGEQTLAGFVHNAGFSPGAAASPFSWTYRNTRSAEIRFSEDAANPGANVRFLNTPAKDISFSQSLVLPEGRYRLTVEAEITGLRAPRSLYWQLTCSKPRSELARIELPEGNHRSQTLQAEFDVAGCVLQRLILRTDVIAESW